MADVERLAKATGMTKTAVVDRAIDQLASATHPNLQASHMARMLAQLDLIPDRPDAFDPLQWDAQGLPR